jgi:hypothetical protein
MAFGKQPSELVLRAQRLVNLATGTQLRRRFVLPGRKAAICLLLCATGLMSTVTVPLDSLSSSRSFWSPWPKWTAETIHCFGYPLRDYEPFDGRVQLYEIQQSCNRAQRLARSSYSVND